MDEDLYDEFGNYIGEAEEEWDNESNDNGVEDRGRGDNEMELEPEEDAEIGVPMDTDGNNYLNI